MIGGPQLGLYMLGVIYPCSNTKGAYAGFFGGLLFSFWLGIGAQVYKPTPHRPPVSIQGCPVFNSTNSTTEGASELLMSLMSNSTTTATPMDVTQRWELIVVRIEVIKDAW